MGTRRVLLGERKGLEGEGSEDKTVLRTQTSVGVRAKPDTRGTSHNRFLKDLVNFFPGKGPRHKEDINFPT